MVRTRKMDNMEKGLQSPRTSSYGRLRTQRRIIINDDEDDDSEDLRYMARRPGKSRLRKVNLAPLKDTDSSESASNTNEDVSDGRNETPSKGKPLVTDEDGTSGSSPTENVTPITTSHSSNMASDGGIRRSTRQRKFTYDTLNQGWLLGSARMRDFTAVVDDDGIVNHEAKDKSGKKISSSGTGGDTDPDYEDMYSRIKRERRKAVGNYYNLPGKTRRHGIANGTETEGFETEEDEVEDSTESSEEDEAQGDARNSKYYLRQKKPMIERFQVPIEPTRNRKVKNIFHLSPARPLLRRRNFHPSFRSPAHMSPIFKHRRRHATHNSSTSSSSSSSSEDEMRFERRKAKSMARARSRFFPMNFKEEDVTSNCVLRDRVKIGSSLADVDPMTVDRSVTFESVGGLGCHIQSLKEMLLLPLMYPEVFEKFKITPPRGVLFYGAPGTGKTLVARALSNECSQGERKVAFFMRKGADCLSKWVGESERQLRLLFDQAYSMRPSIIFFDEIDGLAPVRSTRQDQIHSSIVSTLLALMDGLDNRGEVVVIGATNRIDAIDPALRRPGRFDREFNFPLPTLEARRLILKIHTKEWNPPLALNFVESLAQKTVGYCGADIKALCAEAAFLALRRQYPEIYESKQKLLLDVSSIKIEAKDFSKAVAQLVPASHRSSVAAGRPLSNVVQPLLQSSLNSVLNALKATFPQGFLQKKQLGQAEDSSSTVNLGLDQTSDDDSMDEDQSAQFQSCTNSNASKMQGRHSPAKRLTNVPSHRPRLLIAGHHGQGQSSHLAPAVLHCLERFPIHKMDLPALFAVTAKSPEESCSQIFVEAQRVLPSVLYLPHLAQWYDTLSDTVRATFLTLLEDLDPTAPLLLLATSDCLYDELPEQVQILFDPLHGEVVHVKNPNREERRMYFSDLILNETKRPPKRKMKSQHVAKKKLALAPTELPRKLSKAELKKLEETEERTLRELRMFLREILYKLARDRRFTMFTKPVDTLEVSDYLQVVQQPMDLETMLTKVDLHCYVSVADFVHDIDLISQNALDYNPDREPSGKIIRHRACALKDTAHALVVSELDPEFEQTCEEIQEARRLRGCVPVKFAPKPYEARPQTAPNPQTEEPTVAISSEGNPLSDTPNHIDAQTTPKQYSQRLRGATASTADGIKNKPVINNGTRKIPTSRSIPIMKRRHKSPWFGSRRRTFFRAPVQLKKHGTAAANKNKGDVPVSLTNGFVDKDELQTHGLVKLPSDAGHVKVNVEVRLAQLNWSTQDGAAISQTLPIDPLTRSSDKIIKTESWSETAKNNPKKNKHGNDEINNSSASVSDNEVEVSFNTSSQASGVDSLEKSASVDNAESEGHSEPMFLSKEEDGRLQNSTADSSIISETDLGTEPEEDPHHKCVVINENHLANLLERIVNATSGCTVETLERFHSRLHQCVCSHRLEWDRSMLLKDMENVVDKCISSMSRHSAS